MVTKYETSSLLGKKTFSTYEEASDNFRYQLARGYSVSLYQVEESLNGTKRTLISTASPAHIKCY